MSGIAGVFRRDAHAVSAEPIVEMIDRLAHRGPDARSFWSAGPVSLGHCMLWTTPESVAELLPREEPDSGCAITSDARIDNRTDLAGELGIHAPLSSVSDSALILAAYLKWGRDCPAKLIGDYAFAIWNPAEQSLFLARDPMGVRNLHYYCSESLFAFATEIKALFALPEVPRQLNEVRVGDYLVNNFDDRSQTFYTGIHSLPHAKWMQVTRTSRMEKTYWSLDPGREIRLRSDGEYVDAFRSHFLEAVRCRTRSHSSVGSTLSGGLDSSAIACAMRQLRVRNQRIHTFSAIFPGLPEQDLRVIDERPYMNRVLAQGGYVAHDIEADQISPLADAERINYHLDEPNFAPNLYLHWAMYSRANQSNVRVLLDGFDGDTTVSHGFELLIDLFRTMRWSRLWQEANLLSTNLIAGRSPRSILWEFVFKQVTPDWMYSVRRLLRGDFQSWRANPSLLETSFVDRIGLKSRVKRAQQGQSVWTTSARQKHFAVCSHPLFVQTLEMADKASAAHQVEARYPFFDRRLMEFCLAMPAGQKLGQGWSRVILRKAMKDILPEEIRWRPGKGNLSPNFHRRFLHYERRTLDQLIFADARVLKPYINLTALRASYRAYAAQPLHGGNSMQLFAAANLAFWLRASGFDSSASPHASLSPNETQTPDAAAILVSNRS